MLPTAMEIRHDDDHDRFVVLKNGAPVREFRHEADAQEYIDVYRQAAARLKMETPEDLPLEALTESERRLLYPERT
jgi:hypothetical protein